MHEDYEILEILEIYMDLCDRQEDVIQKLSHIIKKQAIEIQHLQNYNSHMSDSEIEANNILQEYQDGIKS